MHCIGDLHLGVSLTLHSHPLQIARAMHFEHGAGNAHRFWVSHTTFYCEPGTWISFALERGAGNP